MAFIAVCPFASDVRRCKVVVGNVFAGLDIAIYQLFIKRVISHHTPGMQKMSVEVDNYVPFTGSENIYSVAGADKLEGDIPTIDGAAALLPV